MSVKEAMTQSLTSVHMFFFSVFNTLPIVVRLFKYLQRFIHMWQPTQDKDPLISVLAVGSPYLRCGFHMMTSKAHS